MNQNLTALAVMEANGSIFTNKYSEGLPGARYYGGNEVSFLIRGQGFGNADQMSGWREKTLMVKSTSTRSRTLPASVPSRRSTSTPRSGVSTSSLTLARPRSEYYRIFPPAEG